MIALLIGGTVVLCIGLLTVVFGIPIKEFSFGNTMILSGAVVSCTGLVLIGLYFIGREFRNLIRQLEAGAAIPASMAHEAAVPTRSQLADDDRLFSRDQPWDEDDAAEASLDRDRAEEPLEPSTSPTAWRDHPLTRARNSAPPAESSDTPKESTERPRRNIMFSSHRRGETKSHDLPPRNPLPLEDDKRQTAEDFQHRDSEPEAGNPFDTAWPQSSRSRPESSVPRNSPPPPPEREASEPVRERFQPPRRADASTVTIVKSGVVDSMAYSLYSDGSIEAQMPEGMVRFASIDELRAHLQDRG